MAVQAAHKPVELVCVGDVMLGRFVDDAFTFDEEQKQSCWGDFHELIDKKEPSKTIIAGNLECALTTEEASEDCKMYTFKSKPKHADTLKHMRFEVLGLANNHSMDYGPAGLAWTLKTLQALDIKGTGAGPNKASATAPAILMRSGLRVAFFSFSDQYEWWAAKDSAPATAAAAAAAAHSHAPSSPGAHPAAAAAALLLGGAAPAGSAGGTGSTGGAQGFSSTAGVHYIDPTAPGCGADALVAAMKAAREGPMGAHLVVVLAHWGPNWRWQPDPDLRALAKRLAEEGGADLVLGTGPHHIQGVELLPGRDGRSVPVVYSAGKFMDDYKVDDEYRNDIGCVWVARVEGRRITSLKGYPCHIKQEIRQGPPKALPPGGGCPPYLTKVVRAGALEFSWAARRLALLSREMGAEVTFDEAAREVVVQLPEPPAPEAAAAAGAGTEGGTTAAAPEGGATAASGAEGAKAPAAGSGSAGASGAEAPKAATSPDKAGAAPAAG